MCVSMLCLCVCWIDRKFSYFHFIFDHWFRWNQHLFNNIYSAYITLSSILLVLATSTILGRTIVTGKLNALTYTCILIKTVKLLLLLLLGKNKRFKHHQTHKHTQRQIYFAQNKLIFANKPTLNHVRYRQKHITKEKKKRKRNRLLEGIKSNATVTATVTVSQDKKKVKKRNCFLFSIVSYNISKNSYATFKIKKNDFKCTLFQFHIFFCSVIFLSRFFSFPSFLCFFSLFLSVSCNFHSFILFLPRVKIKRHTV